MLEEEGAEVASFLSGGVEVLDVWVGDFDSVFIVFIVVLVCAVGGNYFPFFGGCAGGRGGRGGDMSGDYYVFGFDGLAFLAA